MKYIQIFTMLSISSVVSSFVEKTIFSNNSRLVFPAGIEGTGHHYFLDFWKSFNFTRSFDTGLYRTSTNMNSGIETYNRDMKISKNKMDSLYEESIINPPSIIYPMGCESYPMLHGMYKAMHYPDLAMIAENAEQSGIDLRVIYLKRSLKELIISNTSHRRFHLSIDEKMIGHQEKQFMKYINVLFTNIGVLHSFFLEIDPKFIICHDYDKINDLDQLKSISNFVSPTRNIYEEILSIYGKNVRNRSKNDEFEYENMGIILDRLQKKINLIEEMFCN